MREALIVGLVLSTALAYAGPKDEKEKQKRQKDAEVSIQKGEEQMGQGAFEEALAEFMTADALNPSPAVTKRIAECYEFLGNVAEATASYKRYLEQAGGSPPDGEAIKKHIAELEAKVHVDKARKLVAEKKFGDAIKAYEAAQALKKDPKLWYEIATAYENLGDNARAVSSYERFLKEVPNTPDAGEVEGRIAVLTGKHIPMQRGPAGTKKKLVANPWYTSKLGLGVGAGGLAFAIGGAVALGIASSSSSKADSARTEADFLSNWDSATTASPVGTAFLLVGAAALIASGVIIYLHTRPLYKEAPSYTPKQKEFVPTAWVPSLLEGVR